MWPRRTPADRCDPFTPYQLDNDPLRERFVATVKEVFKEPAAWAYTDLGRVIFEESEISAISGRQAIEELEEALEDLDDWIDAHCGEESSKELWTVINRRLKNLKASF